MIMFLENSDGSFKKVSVYSIDGNSNVIIHTEDLLLLIKVYKPEFSFSRENCMNICGYVKNLDSSYRLDGFDLYLRPKREKK